MPFTVDSVIIWPCASQPPRVVSFRQGHVNVVCGAAKTGKSTLFYILDYCLGSSECRVPSGVARTFAAWFGVAIRYRNTATLIARENPGERRHASEPSAILLQDLKDSVSFMFPRDAQRCTADRIRDFLTELTNVRSESSLGLGPLSFRDLIKINYQPQQTISSPDSLFYDPGGRGLSLRKTAEALLAILSSSAAGFAQAEARRRSLVDRLEKLKLIGTELRRLSDLQDESIRSILADAQRLGLADPSATTSHWSLERWLSSIRPVARWVAEKKSELGGANTPPDDLPRQSSDANAAAGAAIDYLLDAAFCSGRAHEALYGSELSATLNHLRREYGSIQQEISHLSSSIDYADYNNTIDAIQSDISQGIQFYANTMALDRDNGTPTFGLRDGILRFVKTGGYSRSLSQIGSARNWVGYHVAVLLALHEILVMLSCSAARFVVFDQPSQAFFRHPGTADASNAALERIYDAFSIAVERTNGLLQIVVLDTHLPRDRGAHVTVAEVWASDFSGLIPSDWRQA
jgi:hypothetical protein